MSVKLPHFHHNGLTLGVIAPHIGTPSATSRASHRGLGTVWTRTAVVFLGGIQFARPIQWWWNGDLMVFNGGLMVFNDDLMVFNDDLMVFNDD